MRFSSPTRAIGVPLAIVFGLAFFAVSMTVQVPTVHAASGPLDAQASELVRLINGARSAAGLGPLVIDTNLASKARDGSIPCPDNAAKTIAGRAQDFAAYSQQSHALRLCNAAGYAVSGTLFVGTLQSAWGYGSVGEILGYNGGYGNGAYLWQYSSKSLWQSWTYATTGHMMAGWMSSSPHRNIILGGYDRVGCGGWASSAGTYYYACEFSRGGGYATRAAPTGSPFSNPLPTAKPVPPAPTAPPAGGGGGGGSGSGGGTTPTRAPTSAPTATPTSTPTETPPAAPTLLAVAVPVAAATVTPDPLAALAQSRDDMLPPARNAGFASAMLQLAAAAAGSVSALAAAFLAIVSLRRRRRESAL